MSKHVITRWEPENPDFWQSEGKAIARRNLWLSIPALLLAFSVWVLWSMLVVNLPNIGFKYTPNQLFWLTALPALSGATLRIFYSFMVPIFGGRKWTALSTATLLIPAIGIGFAVRDPATSYITMLVLALLCGLGGGNFSSSMANISFFFPKAEKGTALGLNAGLGNLGVSVMQFVVPMVISAGVFGALGGDSQTWVKGTVQKQIWLQNAGFVWVPFIILTTLTAWFGMNDLATAKSSFADQAVIFKRKHNWLMCWLYIGTFGSFIGFAAGFPLLIKGQFPSVDPSKYAFWGPLVGAAARPVGGWISDKVGGSIVTQIISAVMVVASAAVGYIMMQAYASATPEQYFAAFMWLFVLLFAASGIGNGSTFRTIGVIFDRQQAGPVLGWTSAVAAYGAFIAPVIIGQQITAGTPQLAMYGFAVFYALCLILNWWFYLRAGSEIRNP